MACSVSSWSSGDTQSNPRSMTSSWERAFSGPSPMVGSSAWQTNVTTSQLITKKERLPVGRLCPFLRERGLLLFCILFHQTAWNYAHMISTSLDRQTTTLSVAKGKRSALRKSGHAQRSKWPFYLVISYSYGVDTIIVIDTYIHTT